MTVSILPKGIRFIRTALAMASSPDDSERAIAIARTRWGTDAAEAVHKATGGATLEGNWGHDLVMDGASREFFALVSERAVIGRLRGTRPTPLRTRVLTQTAGATASWRDEAGAAQVSTPAFEADNMEPHSLAAMIVVTEELVESSDPATEPLVRADLVRAIAEGLDAALLVPDHEIDHAPESITTDATTAASTGDLSGDLKELVAGFGGDLASAYFVTSPITAFSIHGIEFPNVGARGGDLGGVPVITSRQSPAGQLALVNPAGIAVGQGAVEIRTSRHASINLAAEPGMPSELTSLWQTNSVAIMASVAINWRVARAGSVSILTGLDTGGTGS